MTGRARLSDWFSRLVAAIALMAVAACASASRAASPPSVSTAGERYEGLNWADEARGGIFLGIPFAAPPIDALRWKPPQALPSTGEPIGAKTFAPACMQGDYIVSWYASLIKSFHGDPSLAARPVGESEDCLYLNVWSPDLKPAAPLPVMVWIHGGSYKGGWSYEPDYVGDALARRGVIVVSIAYRLGPFGYLAPEDAGGHAPVNLGLMDQVAALKWVKQNIGAFGGDPENITVFGESAGASSIGTLLVSPAGKGLFRRAISESGGFEFEPAGTRQEAYHAFNELRAALAAQGQPIETAPASAILSASNSVLSDYDFGPVVDGDLLPRQPARLLADGSVRPVDLLIGTNRDEWLMYISGATADEEFDRWRNRLSGNEQLVDDLRQTYGTLGALDRLETASQMRCPGRSLARAVSQKGGHSYVYEFMRARPEPADPPVGSYHGAEIPYVFGTHDDWLPTDAADLKITDAMMSAWTAFAATGDPEMPGLGRSWPDYGKTGKVVAIDERPAIRPPSDEALCAAMNEQDDQGQD